MSKRTPDGEQNKKLFEKMWTWALLGIPGSLAFFASVSVQDARSNVAGWLHFFGVERIPEALSTPGADLIIRWMTALMATLLIVLDVLIYRQRSRLVALEQQQLLDSHQKALESIRQMDTATDNLKSALEGVQAIHIVPKSEPDADKSS
jgi:hypothetical protein